MQSIANTLFFVATNGVDGKELSTSDGTSAGTMMVKDIRPGFADSDISKLTVVGQRTVFLANDGVHGEEWWTSDGTGAGTYLIADLTGDSGGISGGIGTNNLAAQAGSKLFVVAVTLQNGAEFRVGDLPTDGGDYDANGQLDGMDFLEWQRRLGSSVSPTGNGADGDGDGVVDGDDLGTWAASFGTSVSAIVTAPAAGSDLSAAVVADAVFAAGDFTGLFSAGLPGETTAAYRPRVRRRF